MFRDSPVWGHGLHFFNFNTPTYGAKYGLLIRKDAHSLPLTFAVDTGVIGLGVLIWLSDHDPLPLHGGSGASTCRSTAWGSCCWAAFLHIFIANLSSTAFLYTKPIGAFLWLQYGIVLRAWVQRYADRCRVSLHTASPDFLNARIRFGRHARSPGTQVNRTLAFWPAFLALASSLGLVIWMYPASRALRVSNLDTGASTFAETYLMFDRTEAGKGYVVDRRDSTMRRADDRQPGRKWRIERIPGPNGERWLTRSKRKGKGTVFYVPVEDVADWTYPFLYDFVRKAQPELELPRISWTQLHVDRLYAGLYLRVALPFDPRKKDGGSGVLRQILVVRGDRASVVDTRFDDAPGLYLDSVTSGAFPPLKAPVAALAWLARHRGSEAATLLMSKLPPHELSLLPLPIDLDELFEAHIGRAPTRFEDQRYARWSQEISRVGDADAFAAEQLVELNAAFAEYAASFRVSLRAHAELSERDDLARVELARRQDAAAELGLGEF